MLKLVIHFVSVAPRIFLEDRRLILYGVGHLAVVAVVAIVIRVVLALAHPLGAALARVGHPEYGVLAAGGHGDGVGADWPARKDAVVAGTLLLAALGERVTVSYHVTLVAARLPPAGCAHAVSRLLRFVIIPAGESLGEVANVDFVARFVDLAGAHHAAVATVANQRRPVRTARRLIGAVAFVRAHTSGYNLFS